MKYNHLFFDLDKTLWDFELNSEETLKELFAHFKLGKLFDFNSDVFIDVYKKHNEQLWVQYSSNTINKASLRTERFKLTLAEFGIVDLALSEQLGNEYVFRSPLKTKLVPGTLNVLEYLKDKYTLHIITNGFEEVQHAKLNNCGIRNYFSEIITSERAGCNKPHKGIFEYSLTISGAKSYNSIMIGDNLDFDILGAVSAGIDQIYFNPESIEHPHQPTFEIKELEEIIKIL